MVCSDDLELINYMKSIKEFGRIQENFSTHFSYSDDYITNYDQRYIFTNIGHNMRMTDVLASAGIEQTKKLELFNKMKGKLNWPINGKIVQKYGMQISTAHIKIPNYLIKIKPENDNFIRPIHKGVITNFSFQPELGNIITIDHADKKTTIYTNLNIMTNLEIDDIVDENSIIGTIIDSTTPINFGISIENKNGDIDFLDPADWLKK